MFLSSNGIIDLADYRFLPDLESEEDKKRWCYFMKKSGGYYACIDLDEGSSFLANWVWVTQEGSTEVEKMLYQDYPDGPVLTPYLRFCLETSSLEQFVLLDLGCGTSMQITEINTTVPAGRAFRYGMRGQTYKSNVLSRSICDTGDLELFEPTNKAQDYYLENNIGERLHSLHNLLMDEINGLELNCQECENPCQLTTSMSETRWKKLSAQLEFNMSELRDVVDYLTGIESNEGYKCPLDVSEKLEIGKKRVDGILEFLHEGGTADKKNSCRVSERGTPYPCTVYRLKDNWEELTVKKFFMPSEPL